MSTYTICSAANEPYFDGLQDLIESILGSDSPETVNFSILDLGLLDEQRKWLEQNRATVVEPGWDLDFPGQKETPLWFRAMTGRPFLRDYFPGYSIYMWLDADIWVQQSRCLDDYIRGAERYGVTIAPELDRCYRSAFGPNNVRTMHRNAYAGAFGDEVAAEMMTNPILNSGAFAMRADSPVWEKWAGALAKGLERGISKHVEQAALNVALYVPSTPNAHYLPSVYNWICPLALPVVNAETGTLHEPNLPFQPLGLIHLTGVTGPLPIQTLDGETMHLDIRYRALRKWFQQRGQD